MIILVACGDGSNSNEENLDDRVEDKTNLESNVEKDEKTELERKEENSYEELTEKEVLTILKEVLGKMSEEVYEYVVEGFMEGKDDTINFIFDLIDLYPDIINDELDAILEPYTLDKVREKIIEIQIEEIKFLAYHARILPN